MTKLRQHIEDMRARLTEIAKRELALVQALGDALSRVDEQLLSDVRNVTAEHEARRGAILAELQSLASRIGSFPAPHERIEALGSDHDGSGYVPVHGHQPALMRGDWRQATKAIDDDLDFLDADTEQNGHAAARGGMAANGDIRLDRA